MKPELKGKDRVAAALSELWESTRKDLAGAWNERLRGAWQDEVDRALRSRLSELAGRLHQAVQFDLGWRLAAELDAATPGIQQAARADTTRQFHAVVRQLTRHQTEQDWHAALAEGIRPFAQHSLALAVRGGFLLGPEELAVDLGTAPAFSNAIESRDTVVALRSPGELSEGIVAALGASNSARCFLVPVVVRDSVPAVLCADDSADLDALEAVAAVAGASAAARIAPPPQLVILPPPAAALEDQPEDLSPEPPPEPAQPGAPEHQPLADEPAPASGPDPIFAGPDSVPDFGQPAPEFIEVEPAAAAAPAEPPAPEPQPLLPLPAPPPRPAPFILRSFREEQALQFARVSVARILLQQPDRVRAGRQNRDLYGMLREEIESAREQYGQQFAGANDYLHEELVQTLADGDPGCLGEDYPGPGA